MAILISTIEELQLIGDDPGYPLDGTYELADDIDASGFDFQPLGEFTGTLDGMGYSINSLTIDQADVDYVGIFTTMSGSVSNLNFSSATVTGNNYVGVVSGNGCGSLDNINAIDVYVNGGNQVGSLIGSYNQIAESEAGTATDCHVTGTVQGSNDIGGLFGYVNRWENIIAVSGCSFDGWVIMSGVGDNVGGLVGLYESCSIENCSSFGSVETEGYCSGGLIGYYSESFGVDSEIRGCYSVCGVNGVDKSGTNGGLVGHMGGGSIIRSFAAGNVTGNGKLGGLVGWNGGAVIECYATGDVTSVTLDEQSYSIGGLVGISEGNAAYVVVERCYASGSVFGVSNCGGFVGVLSGETDISDCYSTGNVECTDNCGGFIGLTDNSGLGDPSATRCYSTGTVASSTGTSGFANIGDTITVTECYWDTETSGVIVSDAGTGRTTAEMKQQSTFTGWDFGTVWTTYDSGYPLFTYQVIYIATVQDLQQIGSGFNSGSWVYVLTNDIDASETVSWNSGAGFKPTCTQSKPFSGTLDGSDRKISGLYMNRPAEGRVSLLGCVQTPTIKDLGFENVDITGGYNVGVLAGFYSSSDDDNGIISNCYSTGTITSGSGMSGGLFGQISKCDLVDCYSTCEVTGGGNTVGGLLGILDNGSLVRCYAKSAVSSDGEYIGGLVGFLGNSDIEECYSVTTLTGNDNVGGLIGYVTDGCNAYGPCYSEGSISINGGSGYNGGLFGGFFGDRLEGHFHSSCDITGSVGWGRVGGLIGNLDSSEHITELRDCYTTGNITIIGDNAYVGGFTGYSGVDLINCYATGDISGHISYCGGLVGYSDEGAFDNCYYTGTIDCSGYSDYLGGLVGYCYINSAVEPFAMRNCYTTGDITGAQDTGGSSTGGLGGHVWGNVLNCKVEGDVIGACGCTGGLLGYISSGRVELCCATGNVTTNNQDQEANIGGLIGYSTGFVKNCYASGDVDSLSLSQTGNAAGGLIGYNGFTVGKSYSCGSVNSNHGVTGGLIGKYSSNPVSMEIFNNYNGTELPYVGESPPNPTQFQLEFSADLFLISVYHFNDPDHTAPLQVTLRHNDGTEYGPFDMNRNDRGRGTSDYDLGIPIKPGTYTIINSIPETWSFSEESWNAGLAVVSVVPEEGSYMCYWDTESSGTTVSACGEEGKTTEEMKQQSTFTGWDFDDTWKIIEEYTYPLFTLPELPYEPVTNSETPLRANKFTFLGWVSAPIVPDGSSMGLFAVSDKDGSVNSDKAIRIELYYSSKDYRLKFSNAVSKPVRRSLGVDLSGEEWHFVACVCEGKGVMRFYVDGMELPCESGVGNEGVPYSVAWSKEVRHGGGDVWVPYLSEKGQSIQICKVRYGTGFSMSQEWVQEIYRKEFSEINNTSE